MTIVEELNYRRICRMGIYDTLIIPYKTLDSTFTQYGQSLIRVVASLKRDKTIMCSVVNKSSHHK